MTPTLIAKRQHGQTFDQQHAINLYKCNIFDKLLSDGGHSQSGANENAMRIYRESNP